MWSKRRSIRESLLVGHGALLAVALAAFGALVYARVRESTLAAVDAELTAQATAIAAAMQQVSEDRFELTLSEMQGRYFRETGHYVIYGKRAVADYSDPAIIPAQWPMRRVIIDGPYGTRVHVGRSIAAEQAGLSGLVRLLVAIGAVVFIVGYAGGWILVGRILNPIQRITRTASSISEANLSSRIDVAVTENELGDLARTLNSAFDRLEAALVRQNRFTADASHELRTPLSVLMTQMELALRKDRSPAEYREVLDICLRAVRRMASIAEGLLFLARADAKGIELRREPLELKEVVEEAVVLVRPLAADRRVQMSVDAESHRMTGDRVRLGEAVTNLVANAILYNRPEGKVEVILREGVLAVSDTGPGIPEEDRPHIFERFYRADPARSRNAGGAGLGLAITKWIVESHGGAIAFSARAGGGTTFQIRFQPAELYSPRRI